MSRKIKTLAVIAFSLAFAACNGEDSGSVNKPAAYNLPPLPSANLKVKQRRPIENLLSYKETVRKTRRRKIQSGNAINATPIESFQSSLNVLSFDGNSNAFSLRADVNPDLPDPKPERVDSRLELSENLPGDLFGKAFDYYKTHLSQIKNRRYIGVIDYGRRSSEKRFFIMEVPTGKTISFLVAHGKNSDPGNSGWAKYFSNAPQSKKSSLGYYLTLNRYYGKHGPSLRLKGLSQTNSNALKRAIVIHGANYVNDGHVGRSWGCPAVKTSKVKLIVEKLEGGALIYAGISKS